MIKIAKGFILFMFLPAAGLAQLSISGRVVNQTDKKPVANVNVFLNNASVGDKTDNDGNFVLHNARTGKYDLVISIVGFESYRQTIVLNNDDLKLPPIEITPKATTLKEVTIKYREDPNRARNLEWFKTEFLGNTELANDCRLINPEVLNLDYDEDKYLLTASSYDFLIIENQALGYRVKYLVNNFERDSKYNAQRLHFEGSVLFEELKGSAAQERRWKKARIQAYLGSEMHFFRSLLANKLEDNGFRVLQYAQYDNPERPTDSVINARIKQFKNIKPQEPRFKDSVNAWAKKLKLVRSYKILTPFHLNRKDLVSPTAQENIYALGCEFNSLHITYNKDGQFPKAVYIPNLNDRFNKDVTMLSFTEPYAFFAANGLILNVNSTTKSGVWSQSRVAGMLPSDYELPKTEEPKSPAADTAAAIKDVYARFNNYGNSHVTEKAYLHFDKPYYAAGDTLFFKAYVTNGRHVLSSLSTVLHVDLINPENKIINSIKLELLNGVASGDFLLPDTLKGGNFRVRAYTNWMRNQDDDAFFYRTIPVGSLKKINLKTDKIKEKVNTALKNDIQFLPEGGTLLVGIRTKVAFKAIGADGLGIAVNGLVTDQQGKQVAAFESTHLGMGYFLFTPKENEVYTAKASFVDGAVSLVTLPKATDNGLNLTVERDSTSNATLKISATKQFLQDNKNQPCGILISSGGVNTLLNGMLTAREQYLDISKVQLSSGIADITLLSAAGEPMSERLLFVQNNDQLKLTAGVNKKTFGQRDKVTIRLNATDFGGSPSAGNFSVAVTDENILPMEEITEHTIITDLLLTGDMHGFIEQPNYYFLNSNEKTNADLDLVMLTHGYRSFAWRQVLDKTVTSAVYQPEKSIEITGLAKSYFGKPLAKAVVSLINPTGGPILTDTTDEKGRFHFRNLTFNDTSNFVLQAVKADGKNTTKLSYDSTDVPVLKYFLAPPGDVNELMPVYLQYHLELQNDNAKYGPAKGVLLKEVKVRSVKIDNYRSSNLGGPGNADQVVHANQLADQGGQLSDRLNGLLNGVVFNKGSDHFTVTASIPAMILGPALIVVDGIRMPDNVNINNVNAEDVETVEVLKSANASIYGMGAGGGVIVITTKQGGKRDPKDIPSTGILPIKVQGYHKARMFYSPLYDHPVSNTRRDLRSTIYWQPDLTTGEDGTSTFEFFTADSPGVYRMVIEGIDGNGKLGRMTHKFTVK